MFLVGSNERQGDEINVKLQLRECQTTVINMFIHGLDDYTKILASPRVILDCVIKIP